MKNNTEINSEILSNQTQVNYPPPAHAEVGASQLAGGQPVYFTLSYRIIPASVIHGHHIKIHPEPLFGILLKTFSAWVK